MGYVRPNLTLPRGPSRAGVALVPHAINSRMMTSTDLATIQKGGIEKLDVLSTRDLYVIETEGGATVEAARAIIDERVRAWATEGKSKKEIADELGCTTMALANRLKRMDLVIESRRGPQSKTSRRDVLPEDDETDEVLEGEVIDEGDDTPQASRSATQANAQARSVDTVVGQASALESLIQQINLDKARSAATPDQTRTWKRQLGSAISALQELRRSL